MFSNVPFSCAAYPLTVVRTHPQLHQAVVHPDEYDGDYNQNHQENNGSHEGFLDGLEPEIRES